MNIPQCLRFVLGGGGDDTIHVELTPFFSQATVYLPSDLISHNPIAVTLSANPS